MTPRDCPRFDSCDAPLCPMDEDRARRTWFADEPICAQVGMRSTRFVKIQQKIARAGTPPTSFFTVPMLESVGGVKAGIAGLDANSTANRHLRELEWIKKHRRGPGRVWTPEQREAAKERLSQIRPSRQVAQAISKNGPKGSEVSVI